MLRILLFFGFASLCLQLNAAEGVNFYESLAEARLQSAATGKPIFLDAYTTWCAPCKKMEKETFSHPEIKVLLENAFIPLRLDMEQEPGASLAREYAIGQYPTLLVLYKKEELHRGVGFFDVPQLSAFAKTSLDPNNSWKGMQRRFDEGDRDISLLENLTAYAKTASIDRVQNFAYELLKAKNDWESESASLLMLESVVNTSTPLFDSLVAKKQTVANYYSAPVVDERIARIIDMTLFGTKTAATGKAKKLYKRIAPTKVDSNLIRFKMRVAREAGKAKKYGRYAIKWQQKYPTNDPDELEELIYVFERRLAGWKPETVNSWRSKLEALRATEQTW